MVSVVFMQYSQLLTEDYISFIYFLTAVQIPSVLLIVKTWKAKIKSDFHFASNLSKVVMLCGILSMLVFKFTLASP